MARIIKGFTYSKSLCNQALEPRKLDKLVDDPKGRLNSVEGNRRINNHKSPLLRLGRKAMENEGGNNYNSNQTSNKQEETKSDGIDDPDMHSTKANSSSSEASNASQVIQNQGGGARRAARSPTQIQRVSGSLPNGMSHSDKAASRTMQTTANANQSDMVMLPPIPTHQMNSMPQQRLGASTPKQNPAPADYYADAPLSQVQQGFANPSNAMQHPNSGSWKTMQNSTVVNQPGFSLQPRTQQAYGCPPSAMGQSSVQNMTPEQTFTASPSQSVMHGQRSIAPSAPSHINGINHHERPMCRPRQENLANQMQMRSEQAPNDWMTENIGTYQANMSANGFPSIQPATDANPRNLYQGVNFARASNKRPRDDTSDGAAPPAKRRGGATHWS